MGSILTRRVRSKVMKVTGAIRELHRRKACVVLSGEQALADSSGLKLAGLIFASVTIAVRSVKGLNLEPLGGDLPTEAICRRLS